jgi:hypothetical protein
MPAKADIDTSCFVDSSFRWGDLLGIRRVMRRSILATVILLSACATRPQQPEVVSTPPVVVQPEQPRGLIGMTTSDLMHHFGAPALQFREGVSLKLQFRGKACVLDAYLYPSGNGSGPLRVTHVDTRSPSGIDYNQAACVTSLEYPS